MALLRDFDGADVMRFIEECGRVCYKSEAKITDTSAEPFVRKLIERGHESVLEHFSATFKIVCDRGVMAELTRHRMASFSIESTRYCDYSEDGLTVINPSKLFGEGGHLWAEWNGYVDYAELKYRIQRQYWGTKPEIARLVLPMSLATTIVMTANLREWRHILKLRTAKEAHPQMRQVANMILTIFKEKLPVVFADIGSD